MIWSATQRKFQLWLATPPELRPKEVRKLEGFAKSVDTEVSSLVEYSSMPGFWDETYKLCGNIVGEALSDIISAVVNRASQGNIQAAKLCLEMLDLRAEKFVIEHKKDKDVLLLVMNEEDAAAAVEKEKLLGDE